MVIGSLTKTLLLVFIGILLVFIAIVVFIGCDGGSTCEFGDFFGCCGDRRFCGDICISRGNCCSAVDSLVCEVPTPFCCKVNGIGTSCASSRDACPPSPIVQENVLTALDVVSAPELLTLINNGIITQNNPNIGCPPDPNGGFGFSIFFDWTDSISPNGISGYHLHVEKSEALILIDTFVINSEFEFLSCNDFVTDFNLLDWGWFIQHVDNLGNVTLSSDIFEFQFEACRFPDGSPCVDLP